MNRRILIVLIALAICLAGLSVFAEEAYEAGELQVYRVSMEEDETVPVRWYKDTPSFPFMGVRAYYRMMFGEELGFAREGGLVTLTAQDGSTAVWDAEKGTLASDDLTKFIFPPKLKGEGHGNLASGNAMASVLSDRGIHVLGERSGGGSCSVQGNGTAEGWSYTISNNIHLINAAGEDIDAGVPVRAELVTVSEDGTRDYSAFYDFDRIRESIR